MCRRRRRGHCIERLRGLNTNTCCTSRNELLDIVDHSWPIIETTRKNNGLIDPGMTGMKEVEDRTNSREGKHNASTIKEIDRQSKSDFRCTEYFEKFELFFTSDSRRR